MSELTSTTRLPGAPTSHTVDNRPRTHEPADPERGNIGGFFSGAVGTIAPHGTFNEYHGDVNITTYGNRSSEITVMLATLKPVDRSGRYVQPCLNGTRKEIFEQIDAWLVDDDEPNILWLSGSPGTGKSAIASSIVSVLTERRRLGASFFFSRGDVTLSDPTALWRTVAYELAERDHSFASAVVNTLKEGRVDPKWLDLTSHFKLLIEEPLTNCYNSSTPPVIVIDALDECDFDGSQEAQRWALLDTLVHWSGLPKTFKLIVTGRDDRIPHSFRSICKRIILPTGNDVSVEASRDIRRFFEKRFAELPGSIYPEWPGKVIMDDLTARAAGLFIWAETVIGFLKQGLPKDRLILILDGDLGEENKLVKLYRQILDILFQDAKGRTLEVVKIILTAIVLAKVPFHCDELHILASEDKSSVKFVLDKLSSVLSIGVMDRRLRIGHLSFSEFLHDPNQCPKAFLINRTEGGHKSQWHASIK